MQIQIALMEVKIGEASGFDLSALNQYFWYPGWLKADGSGYVTNTISIQITTVCIFWEMVH